MSLGFAGIQFAWSLQMTQGSGIFERLGARPDQLSLLWLAGPITGMLIQPLIGSWSDRTWTRLGRRRPFFVSGAIASALALMLLPLAPWLALAVALVWVLDASVNASMEPFRALVADLAAPEQRGLAYAWQGIAIGAGSVACTGVGALLGWAPFHDAAARLGGGSALMALFGLGVVVLLATIGWTVATTPEPRPIEAVQKGNAFSFLSDTFAALREMPDGMRRVAVVQLGTWAGWFALFIYFSPAVARQGFGAAPGTARYDQGIAWASLCYLAMNVACFVASPLLGRLSAHFAKRDLHMAALLAGAVALGGMAIAPTPAVAMALMAVMGVCWAATLTLPYALLADAVPPRRYGVYMGAFNLFICLPQIACSLGLGPLVAIMGGREASALGVGAVALVLAALATRRVQEAAPVVTPVVREVEAVAA